MDKLLTSDTSKFLSSGALTTPFLDDKYVKELASKYYYHKAKQGVNVTLLESLYNWILRDIHIAPDENFRQEYKFGRTAQEIWQSGLSTGCTDYAVLFATFARQIGIPTSVLHAVEANCLQKIQKGEYIPAYYGHAFCECYYDGQWVLVDPTSRHIMYEYNAHQIELPYSVAGHNIFVPYYRGLDWGEKTNLYKHNKTMESLCRSL